MPLFFVTKDNWFAWLLTNTVGFFVGRERFKTDFATTIGPLVLLPKEWSLSTAKTVCAHEIGGHTFQFWAFGLFLPFLGPWLGIIGMGVFYGLLLPVFFNWFRYRLELHAETQRWAYMIELGYEDQVMSRAEDFAKTVGSKAYGWPLPQSWVVWGFKRRAQRMLDKYNEVG
jgi:hypothetical protein